MVLNILLVVGIIALAYWFGLEGFFSSVIHLGLVIVCGALAFAFWEPITMSLLMGMMPRFAWAVGLIIPFVVFLLVARVVMDKYVPHYVDFSQLVNLIGGGLCGAVSAILCAGILLIGLSTLPSGASLFGYGPYIVTIANGDIGDNPEGGKLWIPADDIAEGLFTKLSAGTFAPSMGHTSLATHRPQMVLTGHLNRLRPIAEEGSSSHAVPAAVEVTAMLSKEAPLPDLPKVFIDNLKAQGGKNWQALATQADQKFVVIDTKWGSDGKTFDTDSKLRIFPTQVRLVTFASEEDRTPHIFAPLAISSVKNAVTGDREFNIVNNDTVKFVGGQGNTTMGWVFLVPRGHTEEYLLVRNLRLPLAEQRGQAGKAEPTKVAAAIGKTIWTPVAAKSTTPDTPAGIVNKPNLSATDVELTALLPESRSKNLMEQTIEVNGQNEIVKGSGAARLHSGGILSKQNTVERFFTPSGMATLRVKINREMLRSFYGQIIDQAKDLNTLFIRDNGDEIYEPVGFVWFQTGSKNMILQFDPQRPIKKVGDLPSPTKGMAAEDVLYVYFQVQKGRTLLNINVGSNRVADLNRLEVK